MSQHQPSLTRRSPSAPGQPADERRRFFGRRRFELSRDLLCTVDFDGRLRAVNSAWQATLGYENQELLAHPFADLVHPDDRASVAAEAARLADGGHEISGFEARVRTRDGRWRWFEWSAHAVPVEGLMYASGRDISHRKERETELERVALLDPLTGLANRRGFEVGLDRELAAARRYKRCPAVVIVDLDRFKPINDERGHAIGDELLRLAARTIEASIRASDLPARIGGDEFAILLPDSNLASAELVAAKLMEELASRRLPAGAGGLTPAASAGVAVLGQPGVADREALLEAADAAMYRAKQRRLPVAVYGEGTRADDR